MSERPDGQRPDLPPGEPRYEPAPGVGRLALWVLLFAVAALAVVLGGVYFT
ncbi:MULTISPECIES: hypothetical protein [Streptomyces]|uniref:hypothetical protein n=1 Tax=Streptomyces TaxID=1883 RepID=UPI0016715B5C|nr:MULTISPECIES: hypothetical protein [Streptomyces]UFR04206.1 hypothetical protein KBP30_24890 [Streptomyces sp. Go40/10]GGS47631.1 hypothetical protein GCM10010206_06810 [Streptomyces cinerochromogenes]